jgi:hypothetical protein
MSQLHQQLQRAGPKLLQGQLELSDGKFRKISKITSPQLAIHFG